MPLWVVALFWGLLAGSALLVGAGVGYFGRLSQRIIAGIMAFGGGVLISALAFDLMDEAYKRGGFDSTAIGFIAGGVVYTAANVLLSRRGAKHRKRSGPPEGLSSSAGMKKAGRSAGFIFGIWASITIISGLASLAGYAVFRNFSPEIIAATTAVAAGAILSMLADTMIPEAFESSHDYSGLITVVGFLAAFVLTKIGG